MNTSKLGKRSVRRNPPLVVVNPPVRRIRESVSDYASANAFLGSKDERKLAHNTIIFRLDDDAIVVRLYSTNIVTYFRDGRIQLNSGGHQTATTKQRMNQLIADAGVRVESDRYRWRVRNVHTGKTVQFVDGITVQSSLGIMPTHPASWTGNPARMGPLARGELMAQQVYEVRYRHAEDGKNYTHDFGKGVKMEAMPDGSIRLYHDTLRLWGDF